ncbi:hypothetical protein HIM_04831 [Hirsutella minnesotensis 3608]|uniref:Pentatricopeptide repeat domain-containing protein n=1 Tax=Hirsutella minnesotensis 3608 TaxID=1043627 RepID=A0A0F8A5P2_9HYPO|nr:hypothetical protein HIM_04831 [Hirsutella minnesotensis 3608]
MAFHSNTRRSTACNGVISPRRLNSIWERCFNTLKRERGIGGAWAVFKSMRQRRLLSLLARPEAELLRDGMLAAALGHRKRTDIIIQAAQSMLATDGFSWPDLYLRIIHAALSKAWYKDALNWHTQLAPDFAPGAESFGTLMSMFVLDHSPQMQGVLAKIYVQSSERKLYDCVIPSLFSAGQSRLALNWRRQFVSSQDLPIGTQSRPFLQFLASYHPKIHLTDKELSVIGFEPKTTPTDSDNKSQDTIRPEATRGQYSDSLLARWFASAWIPVDLALNLIHKLGIRTIGPRSLQSLALREEDAEAVAKRVSQLGELDIKIAPQLYCEVLVFFANQGRNDLLRDLLKCDIHPDEFDDPETRRVLLHASTNANDPERVRVLEGVEWAIGSRPSARHLNTLLTQEVRKPEMGKTSTVLDRMEALGLNVAEDNAWSILELTHQRLIECRNMKLSPERSSRYSASLDDAISVTRRLARHDVPIPAKNWRALLEGLGHLTRLDELDQLCLDVLHLYKPTSGGLVLVHQEDWCQPKIGAAIDSLRDPASTARRHADDTSAYAVERTQMQRADKKYIPTDLPLTHWDHPILKIFDARLQRAIVRWGFDRTLGLPPLVSALPSIETSEPRQFDIARGVRLLALLRDKGVPIDVDVVRSALYSCIILSGVPGRPRDRSRDEKEMATENVKSLLALAWGSELLPSSPALHEELQSRQMRAWKNYSGLLRKTHQIR